MQSKVSESACQLYGRMLPYGDADPARSPAAFYFKSLFWTSVISYFLHQGATKTWHERWKDMTTLSIFAFFLFRLSLGSVYGVTAYGVSDIDRRLYRIDLNTGEKIAIGEADEKTHDIEGLDFHPVSGDLFGIDDNVSRLYRFNLTNGFSSTVGEFTTNGIKMKVHAVGCTFSDDGTFYMAEELTRTLYIVDPTDASAVPIGSFAPRDISALAFYGGTLYGVVKNSGDYPHDLQLVTIHTANAHVTVIGYTGLPVWSSDFGMSFDLEGNLWLAQEVTSGGGGFVARLDTNTAAVIESHPFADGNPEFANLAIDTHPEMRTKLNVDFHWVDPSVASLTLSSVSADYNYSVLSKSLLSENEWTVLFGIPGRLDNGSITTNVQPNGSSGFFKVRGDYSTQ